MDKIVDAGCIMTVPHRHYSYISGPSINANTWYRKECSNCRAANDFSKSTAAYVSPHWNCLQVPAPRSIFLPDDSDHSLTLPFALKKLSFTPILDCAVCDRLFISCC